MTSNQEKQQIITSCAAIVVNRNHKDLIVTESADVRKVLQDADYVVTRCASAATIPVLWMKQSH